MEEYYKVSDLLYLHVYQHNGLILDYETKRNRMVKPTEWVLDEIYKERIVKRMVFDDSEIKDVIKYRYKNAKLMNGE